MFLKFKPSTEMMSVKSENKNPEIPMIGQSSTPLNRLQSAIETLNDVKHVLTDDETWTRYSNIFAEFFSGSFNMSNTIPLKQTETKIDEKQEDVKSSISTAFTDAAVADWILDLPQTYRPKGRRLFSTIQSALKSQTKWKLLKNGKLSRNSVRLEGHLIDLLNYAVTKRKINPPDGWDKFLEMVSDLSIPQSYINQKRMQPLKLGNFDFSYMPPTVPLKQHKPNTPKKKTSKSSSENGVWKVKENKENTKLPKIS